MAGLFEKDIRILMQRKKALLLFLALSVFIGYSHALSHSLPAIW